MTVLTNDTLLLDLAVLITQGGLPIDAGYLSRHVHASFTELGLDSLGHLELMVALGSRYGIRIDDATADTLDGPAATLAYLAKALHEES